MAKTTFTADLDTTLPEVAIVIGGEERPLSYDMAAISRVERETGINLFTAVLDAPSASAIVALLYAALLHSSPELTRDQVSAWVTPGNWLIILEAVRVAWMGSVPEAEAGQGDAAEGEVDTQAQP